jgi:hypothetical protein
MSAERSDLPREDPHAQLELALISEFLQRLGYSLASLHELPADQADALFKQASLYASGRLSEVESRAHYIDEMRQGPAPPPRTPRT